jgi:hypothetical protein
MSCLPSVQVFDEREGNWNVHLQGAKYILQRIHQIRGGYLRYFFLHTWFLYHEILGVFSEPTRQGSGVPLSLRICQEMGFDKSQVSTSAAVNLHSELRVLTVF